MGGLILHSSDNTSYRLEYLSHEHTEQCIPYHPTLPLRTHTNTIPVAEPERRVAPTSVTAKHRVPGVQLFGGDAVVLRKDVAVVSIFDLGVLVAIGDGVVVLVRVRRRDTGARGGSGSCGRRRRGPRRRDSIRRSHAIRVVRPESSGTIGRHGWVPCQELGRSDEVSIFHGRTGIARYDYGSQLVSLSFTCEREGLYACI